MAIKLLQTTAAKTKHNSFGVEEIFATEKYCQKKHFATKYCRCFVVEINNNTKKGKNNNEN
ncbi:MAG: hypothetical protein J6V33_02625, partial [Bacteroidales bacterium]|nr:hypothetical protein [Bacteroidales bacterium]